METSARHEPDVAARRLRPRIRLARGLPVRGAKAPARASGGRCNGCRFKRPKIHLPFAAARNAHSGPGRSRLARALQRNDRRRIRQADSRRHLGWQTSQKQAADGILSPTQTEALLAAAQKARAAAGFETVTDLRTGAHVGAPKKLMSGAGGATLNLLSSADGDLAALYARLSADGPARKVAYKTMKPGAFFVVSGQEGGAKFYTRYERDEAADPPIRGFIFSYPAARAALLDRIAIAVANSFEAFPRKPDPAKSAAQPQSSQALAANSQPRATALVVARGQALSAFKAGDCPSPSINGAQCGQAAACASIAAHAVASSSPSR